MNITEIQTELNKLIVLMTEKGLVYPDSNVTIKSDGRSHLYLSSTSNVFDGSEYLFIYGTADEFILSTVEEMFKKAFELINNLPSPEEAVTREYLSKVADAVDYATENSIADEYVNPLRGVSCAMTDNLLTKGGVQ